METKELLRNPVQIGSIFFSGSQSVKKGEPVTWVLDETWAFKTTEKCSVSTNASPFVQLDAGEIFIIYKRTEKDVQEGNNKGIYIFDRDTVVALAYPQEETQDIIIENDIYSNNYNSIVVESDKTPTAKITVSPSKTPQTGKTVTVSGASSYAVSPATITGYSWKKNGQNMGSAPSFSYIAGSEGTSDDIILTITDSDGRKATVSDRVTPQAKPAIPDIIMSKTSQAGGSSLTTGTYDVFGNIQATQSGRGQLIISASCPAKNFGSGGCEVTMYVRKNGSDIPWANGKVSIPKYGSGVISVSANLNVYQINSGDVFTAVIKRTYGDTRWGFGNDVGASPQIQIKLVNRTS